MMTTDYLDSAVNDAKGTAENYFDEIIRQIIDNGDVSNDLSNDYPEGDSYQHENHVDKDYSLIEASMLLDQLSKYKETDWGLWQGLEPEKAVICQAAFTYGNAVMAKWGELVDEINADEELQSLISEYQSVEDEVHAEMDDLEARTLAEGHEKFFPPWDVNEKIQKRKNDLFVDVENKVKEIINSF